MIDYLRESFSAAPHTYADYFGEAFQALFMTCVHALYSRVQWLWHVWNPQMTFHDLLWSCTPDLYSLPQRVRMGTKYLLDTYDVEPRILWFVLTVPPILCLLLVSVFMGAGNEHVSVPLSSNKTKNSHASQSGEHGRHVKKGQSGLGKESARGNKAMSYPLRSNHASSWGPMLGSIGFYGGEIMAYKPIDITAAMKETPVHIRHPTDDNQNSWGSMIGTYGFYGGQVSKHAPYPHLAGKDLGQLLQGDPVRTRTHTCTRSAAGETLAAIAAACMSDTSFEVLQGTTAVRVTKVVDQHPSLSQKQTQKQPAKNNVLPSKLGLFQSVMDIEREDDDTNSDLSEYPPLSSDFEHDGLTGVIDRMMEKTNSMNAHARHDSVYWTPTTLSDIRKNNDKPHDQQYRKDRSIGSKIMDITYGSRLSRDLDAISGGLLGTAIFTVAALASTAETSARFLNEHMPDSVKRFAEDMQESIVRMMDDSYSAGDKDSDTKSTLEKPGAQGISDEDVLSKPKSYAEVVADNASPQQKGLSRDRGSLSSPLTKTYAAVVADANGHSDARADGTGTAPMSYAAVVATGHCAGADMDKTASKADEEGYDECNDSDQDSQSHQSNHETASDEWTQVKTHSGRHHRHKHTHHLVIHPHDEFDLAHHHHQEASVEEQEQEQEKDLTRHQEQGQAVEYTIDEHGNKVPVTDDRRDSGFDMLS